jgi:hypothetical protein
MSPTEAIGTVLGLLVLIVALIWSATSNFGLSR